MIEPNHKWIGIMDVKFCAKGQIFLRADCWTPVQLFRIEYQAGDMWWIPNGPRQCETDKACQSSNSSESIYICKREDTLKHCKNCCPGHSLIVSHYVLSMSWFQFLSLSGLFNFVTKSLNCSQRLCLCLSGLSGNSRSLLFLGINASDSVPEMWEWIFRCASISHF